MLRAEEILFAREQRPQLDIQYEEISPPKII